MFVSTIILTSCEGPEGPPGLDGLDGLDGAEELAAVYEIDNVIFNDANEFGIGFTFPQAIFDADNVLVYRLEDVTNDNRDIWEPLPTATIFLNDGADTTVLYRFNFTNRDVDILLESNNPNLVPADLATGQVFRIVVVPSAFGQAKNLELQDMESLLSSLNLKTTDIIKVSAN